MKILFISGLLSYGGASKLIYDLLPRMKNKGHDCELLILTDKQSKYIEELNDIGIAVHVVPKSVKTHFAKIKYIKEWIDKNKYDVVHVNLFPPIYYCSIVKRILGRKCPVLIMTEHSTDNKRRHRNYLQGIEKFIYRKYDHVISISNKTQENLCKWLGTEGSEKFSVVENGIDIKLFSNANPISKNEFISEYKKGDVLLLTVGSFTPQKNHMKLIEALALLPDNYKLILAGEGPLMENIKKRTKELELVNRVAFLGFRKDIARIMHSVDILIIPSIWEGFGLIAAEGMACGLPIAASNVSGLAEIVGDAGIKFNPNRESEIANAVLAISNEENKNVLIENGLRRVTKYDINNTVTGYLNIYDSMIKKKI